jgi:hypothetical protein
MESTHSVEEPVLSLINRRALDDTESDRVSRRVHRALMKLPDPQRNLINLTYWTRLSQPEIATHLKLPLETVKTRTREALNSLAELLDDDHEYGPDPEVTPAPLPAACSAVSRRPTRFDSHPPSGLTKERGPRRGAPRA